MGLSPEVLFSSTVLVFRAIAFIPWFLREKHDVYFAASWLLLPSVRLARVWNPGDAIGPTVIAVEGMCIGRAKNDDIVTMAS